MPNLQADSILDELLITQRHLGWGKFTQIAQRLQNYVAMNQLLSEEKVVFDGGIGMQWNVMTATSGNAKRTGLFATDSVNQSDVFKQASVPWTHYTTSATIERRQLAMNRSRSQIVDRTTFARADAMIALAELVETDFWAIHPGSSNADQMFGAPYWIVWTDNSGSYPNGGFSGGDPANFTNGAGNIKAADVAAWQNWCAKFTAMTKTDGVKKLRTAATKCNFKPVVQTPGYGTDTPRRGFYTGYDNINALELVLESQNDNLGKDISSQDGNVMFRRTPVVYVPALDTQTGSPFYGIDWDQFQIGGLTGEWLRESAWAVSPLSHTSYQMFVDLSLNTRCTNRRPHFVLATATIA